MSRCRLFKNLCLKASQHSSISECSRERKCVSTMLILPLMGFGWVLGSEGRGTAVSRTCHLPPGLWPRASNAEFPRSAQAGLLSTAAVGPGFLGPGVGDQAWGAAVAVPHFLRKWLRPQAGESFIPEFPWGWWGVEIICKWLSLRPELGRPSKPLIGQCLVFKYLCAASLLWDNRKNRTLCLSVKEFMLWYNVENGIF